MNTFVAIFFCVAIASASAGHLGYGLAGGYGGYANPAAHIPSGSVSVGANGATVAGPAGSVRTDNGLHGHGAGSVVAGPAGDIKTRGGHTVITGPGKDHGDGGYGGVVAAAPVSAVYAAAPAVVAAPAAVGYPAYVGHAVPGVGAWGPAAGFIGGGHGYFGHGGHGYFGHGW